MVESTHPAGAQPGFAQNLHNLDLLRSLAVTMVMYDHTAEAFGLFKLSAGLFGVYLFFLHTSLVLMWSLERQPFVLPFYIRRIFRIYPLAVVAILVSLLFHIPAATGGGWVTAFHPYSFGRILSSLLLMQDLVHLAPVVGVFWSLSIEVQMYVLLPLLFFYAVHERKLWQILLLWVLVVAVISAYLESSLGNVLPTVAPHFLAGVIAFLAFRKFKPILPGWLFMPYLLLLMAIFLSHPGVRTAYLLTLLLSLTLPRFRQITLRLPAVLAERVALYSYGVYIWHLFGIKLSDHWLSGSSVAAKVFVELLFTIVASVVGYHLVEAPMMQLGSRLQKLVRPTARAVIPELEPVP